MEYRDLGRSGLSVSPLCVGTMTYGNTTDQQEANRIVRRAIDAGINFFDCANSYQYGLAEEVLGKAIADTGMREHLVITTKCHNNMHRDVPINPVKKGNSRRQIMEQAEASLRRLGLDNVDLFQLHLSDPRCPIDETLRALDDVVRQGKARHVGTSNFGAWELMEALWCADRHHLCSPVSDQPPYNLLDRRIERELVPMCRTYGLGIICWSPLAAGFLTGKYKHGEPPAQGRLSRENYPRAAALSADRAWAVLEVLRKIAARENCSPGAVALAWCRDQPGITAPIIGPRTLEHLEDNLESLRVTLTHEDRGLIDDVSPPGQTIEPSYSLISTEPHKRWW